MSRKDEIRDVVEHVAQSIFDNEGVELIEIIVKVSQGIAAIEVLADLPEGGITIDTCSALNKKVSRVIEEENLLKESYSVGVSSPGLDRPLRTEKDFKRNVNKDIEVLVNQAIDNQYNFEGKIIGVEDNNVILQCKTTEIKIPLNHIKRAVQIISI